MLLSDDDDVRDSGEDGRNEEPFRVINGGGLFDSSVYQKK